MRRLWFLLFIVPGCFESPVPSAAAADDDDDDDDEPASLTSGASLSGSTASSGPGSSTSPGDPTLGSSSSSASSSSSPSSTSSAGSSGGERSSSGAAASSSGESTSSLTGSDVTESSTGDGPDTTTGAIPDACGDGVLDGGELCDAGEDNGVEPGDCAPDCSAQIQERTIVVATTNLPSSFASGSETVVGVVDDACATEFGAGAVSMFAHGDERRATVAAYAGDGSVDWVLEPWTRYLNDAGELVWLTESIALLGVDGAGDTHDLLHPLWLPPENNPAFTGMNTDWTTQVDANCNDWTSPAGGVMASGNPWFVADWDFLRLPGTSTCGNSRGFYCVLP